MTFQVYPVSPWDSLSAGFLPKWLLFISVVSIANSIQAYTSLSGTRQVYAGTIPSQVTPLSARTFGTWTLLSSAVRLQAALAIHDPVAYRLALMTFVVAAWHFGSEWFGYGTVRWGRGLAGPAFTSLGTGMWMVWAWGFYVS